MKRNALFLLSLSLTGCISAEQAEWNRQAAAEQQQAFQRAYTEDLRQQCAAAGFTAGTDAFANCVLQLHNQNRANIGAAAAAAIQADAYQRAVTTPYCRQLPASVAGLAYSRGQCRP